MALFWDTLFLKVYGTTCDEVDQQIFQSLLTDRLGCQDNPTMMAFGTKNRPGRVSISVRDFARFGLLYLRKGNWHGDQLISREHVAMAVSSPLPNAIPRAGNMLAEMIPGQRSLGSMEKPDNQTDHFGSYSWLWWINGVDREGVRFWPDAPHDTYGAFGHGGPRDVGNSQSGHCRFVQRREAEGLAQRRGKPNESSHETTGGRRSAAVI